MKAILFVLLLTVTLLTRFFSAVLTPIPQPLPLPWSPAPAHTPTPTPAPMPPPPQTFDPNYTNEATGLSMWYPDHWAYEEFVEEVVFASSEEIIRGAQQTSGAVMMVTRSELDGRETLEDLVETTLSELFFDRVEISDQKPRSINGHRGVLVTMEGRPAGVDVLMRGFVAGVEHEGWGYLFMAAAVQGEWPEHGPLLEAMLDSVSLESSQNLYTSATLGLSLTYPEGWIYQDEGEQVIFGTSESILSGAELESGAVMVVIGNELGDPPTVEAMIEMMVSELPVKGLKLSDMKPRTIGGRRGILVEFEGTPEGEDLLLTGFLAGAELTGWGYLFIGISVNDEWCEHQPVLETMLDSVEFMGRH